MLPSKPSYKFGPFNLNPTERRLTCAGNVVAIAPKCFDLLVVLVENGGHLLEKEELLTRLWPNQFVEESSLSFQVSGLRKILGEGLNGQHYIETVPKKGFRFVATITEDPDTEPDLLPEHEVASPTEKTHNLPRASAAGSAKLSESSASWRRWSIVVFSFLVIGVLLAIYIPPAPNIAPSQPIRTIAVLPFKPLGANSRDESLEMGLAEALIGRFSGIKQISVQQMSAVSKYSDVHQDAIKAGEELDVEAVLDGSIQKDGNRVRVTARLTNVKTRATIWEKQFDEDATDIFKLQDSIAERVVQELSVSRLTGEERAQLNKHYTENPEAYELYGQGSYLFNKPTAEIFANRRKALEFYELAIQRDPKFALAYIGIAEFYLNAAPLLTNRPPTERIPKAKEAILKALELDNSLAEAHNALAELKYKYDFDWSGAEEHFKQAISLDPNAAYIHLAHGQYLMCVGLFERADAEMQKAQELYPSSLDISRERGKLLFYQRQYDNAIKHYQRMREVEPTFHRTNLDMSMAYQQKGMYGEAVEEFLEQGRTIGFLQAEEILGLREAFQTSGWQGYLRQRLVVADGKPKSLYIPPTIRAGIYGLLGDKDPAFAWLEKGVEERDPEISQIKINPAYDSLRSDPRFTRLLQRVNLTP